MRGARTPSPTRSATPLSLLPSYPIPLPWEEVGPDVILNPFSPLPSRSRPPPPPWPWMCAWLTAVLAPHLRWWWPWPAWPASGSAAQCAVLHTVLC